MFIRAILVTADGQYLHDPLMPALQPLPAVLQWGARFFVLDNPARAIYREGLAWPLFNEPALEDRFGAAVPRRSGESLT